MRQAGGGASILLGLPETREHRGDAAPAWCRIAENDGQPGGGAGHLLVRSAGRFATPRNISRSAAVALAVFALILFGSALVPLAGPVFSPAP